MVTDAPPSPPRRPPPLVVCDAPRTASLLDHARLVQAIAAAATQYQHGQIHSPARAVLPMGSGGVLLSMPATAADIGIHKLVSVQPANVALQLPTIHGLVTVCDAATGRPLCVLDGPELTGRRTAAVSMLAVATLLASPPTEVLLIGTGIQAAHHARALAALHPGCKVWVRGRSLQAAGAFCRALHGDNPRLEVCEQMPTTFQVAITLTTSLRAIYDEPPVAGRLVIGVGAFKPDMAEIGAATLAGSDVYVDDAEGARHEAGDLIQAGVPWERVSSLATALASRPELSRPIVFKSVGSAAWDLAAARVAIESLASGSAGAPP